MVVGRIENALNIAIAGFTLEKKNCARRESIDVTINSEYYGNDMQNGKFTKWIKQ